MKIDPLVLDIAALDGWCCHYCDTPLGWGHESVTPPHVDHVYPKSWGGWDTIENLALACPSCNCSKGARTPMGWRCRPCCDRHGEAVWQQCIEWCMVHEDGFAAALEAEAFLGWLALTAQ